MSGKPHYPNLYAELARNGMSKKEFASSLGVSERTIANILSGKSEFKISELKTIVDLFPDCSPEYLFTCQHCRTDMRSEKRGT